MIRKAVNQWNAHKEELREYFKTHKQKEYMSYESIFKLLVTIVLNAEGENNMELSIEEMTVVDNGDYQGTQIFILPRETYQPDESDYYWSSDYYGSCSCCDTLLGISDYDVEEYPTDEQVKEYMTVCLHQIQRLRKLKM